MDTLNGDDNSVSTTESDDTEEITSNPPNVLGMYYTRSQVSLDDT